MTALKQKMWQLGEPIKAQSVKMKEFEAELDIKEWYVRGNNKKFHYESARDFLTNINHPKWKEHKQRCDAAETKYPIIVCRYSPEDRLHILDGLHRLCRAVMAKDETIMVKLLSFKDVDILLALEAKEMEKKKTKKNKKRKR